MTTLSLLLGAWRAEYARKNYARKNDAVYLDYHSAVADPGGRLKPDPNDDRLHPNAAGYAVMAPLAEKAIEPALSRLSRAAQG